MIYYFDIYGSNINLYYKNNKIFKTKIGAILGIISIIIFLFIFFYLFSFLFKRKQFNIINNYEMNLNSSINFNNVPFFFGLINKNGEVINYNKNVFNFYLYYFEQIIDSNFNAKQIRTTLNLSECDKNIHFKDYIDIFQIYTKEQISKFICISKNNIDLILKGNIDSNIYTKIILTIEKCVNTTNYSECYDSNTINSILESINLYYGYLGYNIDHFSFKNPLKRELRYKILPLSNYFKKKFQFFFNHCKYQSDNGLILTSYKSMNFFELETYISDILDFISPENQILSEIEFSVNENNKIYIRKYQKVQECFTIIKSTIDIIYIFIKIFYDYFIDKYEIIDMADNLIIKKTIKKTQSNFSNNINNINLSLIKIKQNQNLINDFKIPLKHKSITRINKKIYKLDQNLSKEIIIDDKTKNYILNEKIYLKWYYYFFPIILYNIKNKELKKFVLFKNILNENLSLEILIKNELNNIKYENFII